MKEFKEIRDLIEAACPEVDTTEINEHTTLDRDLGIDSLGMVMLTIEIEKKYNTEIDNFPHIKTVGELIDYIKDIEGSSIH